MAFRKVGEREVYDGRFISVGIGTYAGPDGDEFERTVVHHPGAVAVVAIDGDDVILVRQYRAAVDAELLELPAGKRDVTGEEPALTAHRELVEEVGLRAGSMELLGEFYNSPGFCDEHMTVFLATGLEPCAHDRQGDEELAMTVERHPLASTAGLIASGAIVDAKTIIGLMLAERRRESA